MVNHLSITSSWFRTHSNISPWATLANNNISLT